MTAVSEQLFASEWRSTETSTETVSDRPRVSVIIPARNEARNLVHVLPYIPDFVEEVILVDGHSTDDTIAVARRLLPTIKVVEQVGRGKGDALRCGFAASAGDFIVMMDADGSTSPTEIPNFVRALENGAEFAKGTRFAPGGGSADITRFRKLGNRGLSLLVNILYGTRYSDLCYGYNAFVRECLDCLTVDCAGFEVETLLNLRAHKAHVAIAEVPSYEHVRIHGISNLLAVRDGLRVVRTILREWAYGDATVNDARCIPALARRRMNGPQALSLPSSPRQAADHTQTYSLAEVMQTSSGFAYSPQAHTIDAGHEPSVAVVLAAYSSDRWNNLIAAVESVRTQSLCASEIVVVVDHNAELLARAQAQWDDVLVVENTQARGLSGARNTGIAATTSELIAFLDDDAVAEPDWLNRLARACDNPLVLGVSGWVEPEWQANRPSWFPREFDWVVGCSHLGLPRKIAPVRNLIGSSMCIRRAVLEGVGGFIQDLGRVGAVPTGCEESELCVRALQRWPEGIFMVEPDARIHHMVPRSRSAWRYFGSRCYHEGRSKARMVRAVGRRDGLSSERAYTIRVLPLGIARGLWQTVTRFDVSGLARAFAIVAGLSVTTVGYLVGRLEGVSARKRTHGLSFA